MVNAVEQIIVDSGTGFDTFKFIEDGGKFVAERLIHSWIADHRNLLLQRTSKKLFTADGQPIMYQLKDKDGNPKFKDGQPVMRQKIEMVELADGEAKPTFSLLAAKWWFAENFPEAVKNVPERASTKEVPVSKLFENW